MPTALITHPACLRHDTGPYHPECPDRLRAVLAALETPEFADLLRESAPHATTEQLTRVHPANYVEAILSIRPAEGEMVQLDAEPGPHRHPSRDRCAAEPGGRQSVLGRALRGTRRGNAAPGAGAGQSPHRKRGRAPVRGRADVGAARRLERGADEIPNVKPALVGLAALQRRDLAARCLISPAPRNRQPR